jgi:excisionase family DNA binding protein
MHPATYDEMRPISVTVAQALQLTGLGKTLIYEKLGTGELTSQCVGRRRLIDYASLEALVRGSTEPA